MREGLKLLYVLSNCFASLFQCVELFSRVVLHVGVGIGLVELVNEAIVVELSLVIRRCVKEVIEEWCCP